MNSPGCAGRVSYKGRCMRVAGERIGPIGRIMGAGALALVILNACSGRAGDFNSADEDSTSGSSDAGDSDGGGNITGVTNPTTASPTTASPTTASPTTAEPTTVPTTMTTDPTIDSD